MKNYVIRSLYIVLLSLWWSGTLKTNFLKDGWSYYVHAPYPAQVAIIFGSLYMAHQTQVLYKNVFHYLQGYLTYEEKFVLDQGIVENFKETIPFTNTISTLITTDLIVLGIVLSFPLFTNLCIKSVITER